MANTQAPFKRASVSFVVFLGGWKRDIKLMYIFEGGDGGGGSLWCVLVLRDGAPRPPGGAVSPPPATPPLMCALHTGGTSQKQKVRKTTVSNDKNISGRNDGSEYGAVCQSRAVIGVVSTQ